MSKNVKIIIGVLVALFVGFIILVAVLASALSGGIKSLIEDNQAAKEAARNFTTAMADEDYEEAYMYIGDALMEQGITVDDLDDVRFDLLDTYESVTFNSVSIETLNGTKYVTLVGNINTTSDTQPIVVILAEEEVDGEMMFRIDTWSIDPADFPEESDDEYSI
tara:strand:+ start:37 stop:528 length:492 start_codon:yes stop_codon:yes gene_type:complete